MAAKSKLRASTANAKSLSEGRRLLASRSEHARYTQKSRTVERTIFTRPARRSQANTERSSLATWNHLNWLAQDWQRVFSMPDGQASSECYRTRPLCTAGDDLKYQTTRPPHNVRSAVHSRLRGQKEPS